jgi:hypothetical protein
MARFGALDAVLVAGAVAAAVVSFVVERQVL